MKCERIKILDTIFIIVAALQFLIITRSGLISVISPVYEKKYHDHNSEDNSRYLLTTWLIMQFWAIILKVSLLWELHDPWQQGDNSTWCLWPTTFISLDSFQFCISLYRANNAILSSPKSYSHYQREYLSCTPELVISLAATSSALIPWKYCCHCRNLHHRTFSSLNTFDLYVLLSCSYNIYHIHRHIIILL